jgi:type I restriction enzyme R subunit
VTRGLVPLRRYVLSACDGPFGSALKTEHYSDSGARVIRLGNIGSAAWLDQDFAFVDLEYWAKLRDHHAVAGDLIVAALGDENHPVGRACVLPDVGPAMVKADCYRLRLDPTKSDARFLAWYMSSSIAEAEADRMAEGATRARLTLSKALSLPVPEMPSTQQRAIADYLDAETAALDSLVAAERERVTRSQERLASAVEALVLGPRATGARVNEPDGPLAPVPTGWALRRNKTFIREVIELSQTGKEELLSVSHLTGVTPRAEKTVYMFLAESNEGYKLVKPGDVVINTMWAWMGALGVSRYSGIVSPAYGVYHAKAQYRTDRDPANVTLGRRAVVHFAADPDSVEMTTRLAGPETRFLPFNRGDAGGKGNPPDPTGHRTRYLWEDVWSRDAWMDLLGRFVHVIPGSGPTQAVQLRNGAVIFPRYHQWDAVRRLEATTRAEGPGRSYLVEHSAGSGKSNTIAWLAHRLMSLHGADDRPVFDKVVVITDRVILDRQLQETIYQFEHATGVVARIDEDSAQLAQALAGELARIVITTLQKFPFILTKVRDLGQRRFAVIIDEAHSSQTGESAKDLKAALGSTSAEAQLAAAEHAEGMERRADAQDALVANVAARGRQPNLSFFAFTATPKARTLELFGRQDAEGRYAPFHLYSMRQAIEEGFILDVLANYVTYQTYWKVGKAIEDDPLYDTRKANRSIGRFVALHPHNLAQKAEIIVEHFRTHTRQKIAGKGKAMVVTSSRLHAVRYKQAIDAYLRDKGYIDTKALVAFSGTVDDSGIDYTESLMNGFPESQTANRFNEPGYGVLIVAEKFQTGYDQPLLHTMFVDKILVGLAAVQTLSRLNRIHPEKTDTFVLDFRNLADQITKSFEPWYEMTVAVPTDPNLLHDLADRVLGLQVIDMTEARAVGALIADRTKRVGDHGMVYALLAPAVGRFKAKEPDEQAEARDALDGYARAYSFLSQVVDFGDAGLEALYLATRALLALLPTDRGGMLDLGSEVELTHLRLEQTSQGSLTPDHGLGELKAIYSGKGPVDEPEKAHLSKIVDVLNERFGLQLTLADQLFFDQLEATWLDDPQLAAQARANPIQNFRLVFADAFMKGIVERMDDNAGIFKRILDDPEFQASVMDHYLTRVFHEARSQGAGS